jgi:uncharacterized protein YegL
LTDYTVLMLIVDQSGSMSSIKEETQQSMDRLIADQKSMPGRLDIKLVTFSHNVQSQPLVKADNFAGVSIEPGGMTALYDAMGLGTDALSKELNGLEDKPTNIIVLTVTDGFENASQEYNSERIQKLIKFYSDSEQWEFMFLGSNQDAILTAKELGMKGGSALTYDASSKGVNESVAAASRYISATRSGLEASFTDEDRTKSV